VAIDPRHRAIDVGVVVRDAEASLRFYRDVVGAEHVADTPMPGGGTMHRLMWGETLLKLVSLARTPDAANPPGGFMGASGIRYITFSVDDLDVAVARCRDAGSPLAIAPREIRPGVSIAVVEDPDGNWVEFLHQA